jgi:hypothetical protein
MKDVSQSKAKRTMMKGRKHVVILQIQILQAVAVIVVVEDQEAVRGQNQDHVQSIEVNVVEGLEVDLEAEAEEVAVRMANWTLLIVKMLDARQSIEIFKRNERRKRREMNMKVF